MGVWGLIPKNGGEDDEVASMASSDHEEVQSEACGAEAGGLGSGAGGCRWSRATGERGQVDGGDYVEGIEGQGRGLEFSKACRRQEELYQRG